MPIWNSFATAGVRDFWENGCSLSCRRSSSMSCMLAFMTADNYQAVGEVNAALAALIGE